MMQGEQLDAPVSAGPVAASFEILGELALVLLPLAAVLGALLFAHRRLSRGAAPRRRVPVLSWLLARYPAYGWVVVAALAWLFVAIWARHLAVRPFPPTFLWEMYALVAYLFAVTVLVGAGRRLGTFLSLAAFLGASAAYLKLGFNPAIPSSAFILYFSVLVVAVLLYGTASEGAARSFWEPIRQVIVRPALKPVLYGLLLLVPAGVALAAYVASMSTAVPPAKIRSIHPAPPNTMTYQPPGAAESRSIDVLAYHDPYRPLETSDPAQFAQKVARGKVVYYENCFFCHGDTLAGDGHFAAAVKPPPANFQDAGVLPMLEESFIFWRVAKGGPGLPEEATPFDSSMPVWEKYLSEEDTWSAILFLYDYSGRRPRASDAPGHAEGEH